MKLIRLPETLEKTGLTRTRLYALVAKKEFPQPAKIGGSSGRAIAWPEPEVEAWIQERLAAREAA